MSLMEPIDEEKPKKKPIKDFNMSIFEQKMTDTVIQTMFNTNLINSIEIRPFVLSKEELNQIIIPQTRKFTIKKVNKESKT